MPESERTPNHPPPGAGGASVPGSPLPERYRFRDGEDGRFLVCEEAPRIRVNLHAANSFSEAEARELGERTILLDGAGSFGPLLDPKNRLYNLDHHENCERAITLATCEQALLLVNSGLELGEGDWTIYANEPDLDTVLALWCLLNFQRVPQLRPAARDVLYPLVRLEGAIDANGSELAAACGLPSGVFRETQKRLDRLMARETALKNAGEWHQADWAAFTHASLGEIDRLIYTPADFREYASVEEIYGHLEIAPRRVAVACRDRSGIYDVEQNLKARWGDQLCIVALEKEPGHFTLRRTASLSGIDLHQAYDYLNRIDPHVDGRPPGKRWGGSASIGGSPRISGTGLGAPQILRALESAYGPTPRMRIARHVAWLAVFSVALAVVATLASLAWNVLPGWVARPYLDSVRLATFAAVALAVCLPATLWRSERRPWLYGWRIPAGRDWFWIAPLPVLAALPNRAWVPQEVQFQGAEAAAALGAIALAALACEFWFRGLVHGSLLVQAPVQRVGGPWFVSQPNWISALLFGLITVAASLFWVLAEPIPMLAAVEEFSLVFGASVIAGLVLGVIRERSLSVWPCIGIQVVAGVATAACWVALHGRSGIGGLLP